MWNEFLMNSNKIDNIFSNIPQLKDVELVSLSFLRDASALNMIVELKDYPVNPPKKWKMSKYNTVQLTFMLIDISEIELSGWSTKNEVSMEINKIEEDLFLKVSGDLDLIAKFKFLDIGQITAYQKT